MLLFPLMLALAATQDAAHEHQNAPTCAAPVPPTGPLAPWASATPLPGNQLTLGKAAVVTLSPADTVLLTPAPAKPAPAGTYSGILWIDVPKPATYRIALSGAAWLDVVGKDGALRSTAHAHGPDCSGIRKMVDFTLAPGRYTINIAGSASQTITVLALVP